MKSIVVAGATFASLFALAAPAAAQGFQGGFSTQQGGYGNSYGTYGATGTAPQKIENIGRDGQFIFSLERLTGVFFERQSVTYDDETDAREYEHTFKGTTVGVLGMNGTGASTIPRFALDYVLFRGITVGGSLMFVSRSLELDDDGGQAPATPPIAGPEGNTFLAGARAGFAYPFDETFGVWPRGGLSYVTTRTDVNAIDPSSGESAGTFQYRAHTASVNLELLAVISPVKHVVILLGPYFDLGLGGSFSAYDAGGEELDRRGITTRSYGALVHAGGYY
jgi:hypothetical protein